MVEIGKRDFIGQGRLAMDLFEPNRSFFGVDLAHMYIERPKKIRKYVPHGCVLQRFLTPLKPFSRY